MAGTDAQPRAVDRVTAFTDAAVAIALTLLVLPLVDVAHEGGGTPVAGIVREHAVDLLAFVLSFFVVAIYWRAHRRLFDLVRSVDEPLLVLNTCWLLGVVFLPVPTAVLTFEEDSAGGATMLYLANLFFVSLTGLALAGWLHARPALQRAHARGDLRRAVHRGAVVCTLLAAITALAPLLGTDALFLLLALPAGRWLTRRLHRP